ncbi:hypothetical protein SAMN05421890_1316 [Ensifer adhaerens]|nr:hypothetical protein SAMN05421890_1316 [Ensifer adhaerens]
MSFTHASTDVFCGVAAPDRMYRPVRAMVALADATRSQIDYFVAAVRHRAEMRRLERFSNHTLQDIGFERDWDGTVIPRQK